MYHDVARVNLTFLDKCNIQQLYSENTTGT